MKAVARVAFWVFLITGLAMCCVASAYLYVTAANELANVEGYNSDKLVRGILATSFAVIGLTQLAGAYALKDLRH